MTQHQSLCQTSRIEVIPGATVAMTVHADGIAGGRAGATEDTIAGVAVALTVHADGLAGSRYLIRRIRWLPLSST